MASAPLTAAGMLSVLLGLMICDLAAITGLNLILFGCSLFLVAAGFSSRIKRLCPACRMEVPRDALACGHCRRDLPA